jgi:hypothetical protein
MQQDTFNLPGRRSIALDRSHVDPSIDLMSIDHMSIDHMSIDLISIVVMSIMMCSTSHWCADGAANG